ncbi:MAG: glycosyl hydrolase [Burkholderiaceae bacterium]|nr:glycosyl hydrolase [Burkholderiaceae bacterium]
MRPLLLLALVVLALLPFRPPPAHAAGGGGDTLEEAAVRSPHASRSLLVGAARAGGTLVVAGERGHILYSDDGGNHWQQAEVPVSVTLTALCFADARTGWAVGHRGVVLKSIDAGRSWTRQLDGRRLNELVLDAVGSMPRLVAEARRFAEDGADKPFLDVVCTDENRVAAIGAYGLAVKSSDGGKTWAAIADLMTVSDLRHLNAVVAIDGTFVLAGEQGALYRASADWTRVEKLDEPTSGSFFDVVATPAGTLVALGLRGNLFRSVDHGATWTRVEVGSTLSFNAGIARSDGSVLLLDEAGGVWRSTDDGRRFARAQMPGAFPFSALVQAGDGKVLAVGARGLKWIEPVGSTPP